MTLIYYWRMDSNVYEPMMSPEHAEVLRRWHERVAAELNQLPAHKMQYLGLELDIPDQVFPPSPPSDLLGRAVVAETTADDRVLDMGTGSGNNALLAARTSTDVVGVDINPYAVVAAARNAERNGVSDRTTFVEGDLFEPVTGRFDLIIFDPPFRWFRPTNLLERAFTDEDYRSLTRFVTEVGGHLTSAGRVLLFFGTSGDIDYLHHLIDRAGFDRQAVASQVLDKEGVTVEYVTYRLTYIQNANHS